jgi:hypothetical protein
MTLSDDFLCRITRLSVDLGGFYQRKGKPIKFSLSANQLPCSRVYTPTYFLTILPMKTTIALISGLLLVSATLVSAQHRFGLSITAAPTYAYANSTQTIYLPAVYVPSAPAGSTDPVPVEWSSKNHAWGYVVGGMLHYRFSSNWSASTGLWYSHSRTNGITPLPYTTTPTQTHSYGLQAPLLINYRPGDRRLSPYFSVGGLANFRQRTSAQYDFGSGLTDVTFRSGKAVTYRPVLGAGIAYRLNPHLSLIAQPLLIWNVKPNGNYTHYTSYQVNGQTQLVYSF